MCHRGREREREELSSLLPFAVCQTVSQPQSVELSVGDSACLLAFLMDNHLVRVWHAAVPTVHLAGTQMGCLPVLPIMPKQAEEVREETS